jgi:hypothetical protein
MKGNDMDDCLAPAINLSPSYSMPNCCQILEWRILQGFQLQM